jgi:hypothetical protein
MASSLHGIRNFLEAFDLVEIHVFVYLATDGIDHGHVCQVFGFGGYATDLE